jgi:hypothetical protein
MFATKHLFMIKIDADISTRLLRMLNVQGGGILVLCT